jgi:hypothetical protein
MERSSGAAPGEYPGSARTPARHTRLVEGSPNGGLRAVRELGQLPQGPACLIPRDDEGDKSLPLLWRLVNGGGAAELG